MVGPLVSTCFPYCIQLCALCFNNTEQPCALTALTAYFFLHIFATNILYTAHVSFKDDVSGTLPLRDHSRDTEMKW